MTAPARAIGRRPLLERLGRSPESAGVVARWWFAACALLLVFGSDYDLRTRPPTDALEAGIDRAILLELTLYAAVAGYVAAVHAGTPTLRRVPPQIYVAAFFIGLMALSLLYTPFAQYALVRVVQMTILLGLVVAAASHATRAHFHRFAHGFLALVLVSIAYGIAVPSPPINRLQEGRFTWFAIHPTVSGVLAGFAVLVALSYRIAPAPPPGPRWRPGAYTAGLLVAAGALLASQTRGAILGTIVGILLIVFTTLPVRRAIEAGLGLLLAASALVLVAGGPIMDYVTRGEDVESLETLNSRTVLWEVATEAFVEQPVYGYGITAAQGIFYDETGLGGGHNAFVNLLVELGLVGLACFLALVVVLLRGLRRLPRDDPRAFSTERSLLLGVIGFLLVDGMFFSGAGGVTNVASTWLFVSVGWLTVAQREQAIPVRARRALRPLARVGR